MARKIDPSNRLANLNKFSEAVDYLLEIKEFENITIKDICKEAKLSIGLFYYYFESKDHIFFEKFTQVNHRCKNYLDPLLRFEHINEDLNSYIDFYITNCIDGGYKYFKQIYKFLISNPINMYDFKTRELYKYLHKIIEAGQAKGEVSSAFSCDELCDLFFTALRGFVFKWISSEGTSNLKSDITNYTSIFLKGIST